MILHVKPEAGAIIATHIGAGETRRMVFITPVGCTFDAPPKLPEGFELPVGGYDVDPGPCLAALKTALADDKHSLKGMVSLAEGDAPKAGRTITRK